MNFYNHLRLVSLAILFLSPATIVADPASRYAIYRSEDQGQSWSRSDAGLPADARINAFGASKNSFTAGTDAGIFLSTNRGKLWQRATLPARNNGRVTSLAALKTNLLFAGTTEGFLLSSSDQGRTWQRNESFPRRNVRSLHAVAGALYVGTDADHVYTSSDSGRTWTHLSVGLPPHSQVFALASLDGQLFAGLYARGLFTWNEQKWRRVGESSNIKPLALAAVGQTLIAGHNPGGIHWSDDLGQTWPRWSLSTATTPANAAVVFSVDSILRNPNSENAADLPAIEAPIWEMSADSNLAIAGAADGIYYSTDRARTWTRATAGLPSTGPGIAFLIQDNVILAAMHQKSAGCTEAKAN